MAKKEDLMNLGKQNISSTLEKGKEEDKEKTWELPKEMFDLDSEIPESTTQKEQTKPETDSASSKSSSWEISKDVFDLDSDVSEIEKTKPKEDKGFIGPDFLQKPIEGLLRAGFSIQDSSTIFGMADDLFRSAVGAESREEAKERIDPQTGKFIDPAIDIGGGIIGTITDFATLGKLTGPIIGSTSIPDVVQPGARFAGTRLARKGLQDISGDEVDPIDYAKSGISGFLAGEAGHLIGEGVRQIGSETRIPESIYPYLERGTAGAGVGATLTGADAGFEAIFDDEVDTSWADLGINMASMAALYAIPLAVSKSQREEINQARKDLSQIKALKENQKRDAFSKLGIDESATKEDIKNRWSEIRKRMTQGDLQSLDESKKLKILSDTKQARDQAYKAIDNMPLSTKIKNTITQKLNEITTGISRRFTGTTSTDLVPVEQQVRNEPVISVNEFMENIQTSNINPEEVTEGKLTTQEISGLLTESETTAEPIIPMPGQTQEEPIQMPGEVETEEEAIELPGQVETETEEPLPMPEQVESETEGNIATSEIQTGDREDFLTINIDKQPQELTETELSNLRNHLENKLQTVQESDQPAVGGESAISRDLEKLSEIEEIKGIEKTEEPTKIEETQIEEPEKLEIKQGDRIRWTTEPVQGDTTTYEGTVRQVQSAGDTGNRYILETDEGQQIRAFDYKGDIELLQQGPTEYTEEIEETTEIDTTESEELEETQQEIQTKQRLIEEAQQQAGELVEQTDVDINLEDYDLPTVEDDLTTARQKKVQSINQLQEDIEELETQQIDTEMEKKAKTRARELENISSPRFRDELEYDLDRIKADELTPEEMKDNIRILDTPTRNKYGDYELRKDIINQIIDKSSEPTKKIKIEYGQGSMTLTNDPEKTDDNNPGVLGYVLHELGARDETRPLKEGQGQRSDTEEVLESRTGEDEELDPELKKARNKLNEFTNQIVGSGNPDTTNINIEKETDQLTQSLRPERQESSQLDYREDIRSIMESKGIDLSSIENVPSTKVSQEFNIQMPEIVDIAIGINEGKYPKIRENFRSETVEGQFKIKDQEGTIELRGDIFYGPTVEKEIVNPEEVERTIEELQNKYQEQEIKIEENPTDEGIELRVQQRDPGYAAKVLSHEIGHLVDWLPDKDVSRGNILGRIKSLKRYMKNTIEDEDLGEVSRDEIMNELKELSQYWKPFSTEEVSRSFQSYRESPEELYADAVSVLINEPTSLQEIAPKFYQSFMNNLDKKPKFKAMYEDVQNRLKNRKYLNELRLEDTVQQFERAREKRKQLREESDTDTEGIIDWFTRGMIDRNHNILKYLQEGQEPGVEGPAWEARNQLEEMAYLSSEIDDYLYQHFDKIIRPMQDLDIDINDLGSYLQYQRVLNDRSDLANPGGHIPETAREQLQTLEQKLGENQFEQLEQLANNFYQIRQERVIPRLDESGYSTPELTETMRNNEEYATFNVIEYMDSRYGDNTTARIYEQVGTFQEIENPFVATIMKDISLLRSAKINEVKTSIVKAFQDTVPESIEEADTAYNPEIQKYTAKKPKDKNKEILTIMIDGEPQDFYVPEEVAKTLERSSYTASKAAEVWSLAMSGIRNVFVSKNPGWMIMNIGKDFGGTILKNPEIRIRDIPSLIGTYKEAYKEAWAEAMRGERSEDVSEMMRNYMLTSNRMYGSREQTYNDEIDRIFNSFFSQLDSQENQESNIAKRKMSNLWETLDNLGRVSDVGGQIAGYKFLKGKESKDKINPEDILEGKALGHRVRTRVGTPDFKRKGDWQLFTNNYWLFSNVNKEGWRGSFESMRNNPGTFFWKMLTTVMVPKLIQIGLEEYGGDIAEKFGLGEYGEEIKNIYDGASEYDKRNYNIIPIDRENQFAEYLRIPNDYTGQLFGGMIYDLAKGKITGQQGVIRNVYEQLPWQLRSTNPIINTGQDLADYYLRGVVPYDEYRGQPMVLEQTMERGRFSTEAQKELWGEMWKQTGGSVILDPSIQYQEGTFAKLLKAFPFNALDRYYKINSYGYREDIDKIYKERDRARSIVEDYENTMQKGEEPGYSQEEIREAYRKKGILNGLTENLSKLNNQKDNIRKMDIPTERKVELQKQIELQTINLVRRYYGEEPLE